MKHFGITLGCVLIASTIGFGAYQLQLSQGIGHKAMEPEAGMEAGMAKIDDAMRIHSPSYEGSSASGSYLSGRFAQRHHEWSTAGRYIDYVLKAHENNPTLLKRAMVLAMGAGNYERAIEMAAIIIDKHEHDNSLSRLFLTAEAFKNKDYQTAATHITSMPEGGLSSFIMPLLYSWSSAALGEYDTNNLKTNSIHIYHSILIAEFMGETKSIKSMLKNALSAGELGVEDVERIADIYAHIGEIENAKNLYDQALSIAPDSESLNKKREKLEQSAPDDNSFINIKTPEQGVAEAFYDMARLLTQDYSDESARVFANVALYLNPQLTKAKILLARVSTRNERYDEAISFYKKIEKEDDNFLTARRNIANILHEQDKNDDAIQELEMLASEYNDLDALIQIGDIHRAGEQFKQAIKAYNSAADRLGEITDEYWHLFYVRGMSYEQDGQWKKAEQDLLSALKFQPDHPYLLNYLGYAWADQGERLEDSLRMIKRAVELRPADGYITDSLGWVYYRMGQYKDAVPHLEQAVQLLPYDPVINDHLGDAYWKVGRHLEAEFQWKRAKNHAEDPELILSIETKLQDGLKEAQTVKEAQTRISETQNNSTQSSNVQ